MKVKWWNVARTNVNKVELPAPPLEIFQAYSEFLTKVNAQLTLLSWKERGNSVELAIPPASRPLVDSLIAPDLTEFQKLKLIDAVFEFAEHYDGEHALGVRLYPGFIFCREDRIIGYAPPPFLEQIYAKDTIYGPVLEAVLIAHPEKVREESFTRLSGKEQNLMDWLEEKFSRMRLFKLATDKEMDHYRVSLEKELLRLNEI